ncbi:hypothetical protein N7481_006469 [Penicillium waksmanii]|uniref:uncharacterized protein n=1 Tax=Penicillium waksmanii TaxID=69791 RepID=UPI002546D7AA|nr:uncharacterized protein N7481_006469 [Penicillium waksmanii]KAJ5984370.1 hypothetical protein N7481_006469 [Penicillium waksmanii]
MTRKKKPQPQPQPQPQIYEVELAKRLKVVEKERFQEGLMLLNEEWQELEALTLMDESEKNGDCMGMDMDMDMGMGMGKPIVKKASKPGPAPALSPGPGPIFKVSAVPAILSKFEVICDSLSYSHKSSDCSEQSFHTARSDCTNESFHTAPGGSDGDGDGEKEADAEAEKAFLNSRIICEHWQVELDRAQDERADSTIREIANIGRERE